MKKKAGEDPQIKGMIEGSKVSLIFLVALVIFSYHVQFSIILALVAGVSYGLLVSWWYGQDEPPAQPLLKNLEQAMPHKKGRNSINFARDERKKQKQIRDEQVRARTEKLERAKQRNQQSSSAPDDDQNAQGNNSDPDQN